MPKPAQTTAKQNILIPRYTWVVPKPLLPAVKSIMAAFADAVPAYTIRKIVTAGIKLYNELGPEKFAEYIKERS